MTATIIPKTIADLRRKAAALPRPLKPGIYNSDIWMPSEKGGDTKLLDIRGWGYLTGRGSGALGMSHEEGVRRQVEWCDAIVAACNALPALLDEVERLRVELQTEKIRLAESERFSKEEFRVHQSVRDERDQSKAHVKKLLADLTATRQRIEALEREVQTERQARYELQTQLLDGVKP